MQIFGNDFYSRSAICQDKGATSILFKIDDSGSGSDFFDWIADAQAGNTVTIDLNKVIPKTTGATNIIYGYSGTDTMPGCTPVCWYVLEAPQTITTAQRDFFIYNNQASNARVTGLGSDLYTAKFFWYGAFHPEPTPPPTPPTPPGTAANADL